MNIISRIFKRSRRKESAMLKRGKGPEKVHPLLHHIPDIDLHAAQVKDVELNNRLVLEQARLGKFTASEFHRLMTYEDKIDTFPKSAVTYVREKVAEVMTGLSDYNDCYISDDMQWGKDHELEAIERFKKETGKKVIWYGDDQKFIDYNGGDFDILVGNAGGTPDGHISKNEGIEVKCPKSRTHLSYILDITEENFKENLKDYYWQVQGYMMLTGRKVWYFVTYDNRFQDPEKQIKIVKVERDEADIQKLKSRLNMAVEEKNRILEELGFAKKVAS